MAKQNQAQLRAEKLAYWTPYVEAWQSSKLSATQYCKDNNVPLYQFKYWQYQINPTPKQRKKQARAKASAFIQVDTSLATPSSIKDNATLEIKTDFGFSLVLNSYQNFAELSMLFNALRQLK